MKILLMPRWRTVIFASGMGTFMLTVLVFGTEPAATKDVIVARSLLLLDSTRKRQAQLEGTPTGASFMMFDRRDNVRLALAVMGNGPILAFRDRNKTLRLFLGAVSGEPIICFLDREKKPQISLGVPLTSSPSIDVFHGGKVAWTSRP